MRPRLPPLNRASSYIFRIARTNSTKATVLPKPVKEHDENYLKPIPSRYTTVRHAQHGPKQTTWLAEDSEMGKKVLIRMIEDNPLPPADANFVQLNIFDKLYKLAENTSHEGRHHIVELLDRFPRIKIKPEKEHDCFVYDEAPYTLRSQMRVKQPVHIVKKITKQVLLGLDFLHSELGGIHCNLRMDNIKIEMDRLPAEIRNINEPDYGRSNKQKQKLPTLPLLPEDNDLHVRIINPGTPNWTRDNSRLFETMSNRAPEVTIGAPWGNGVDIWALGCIIIELLRGQAAFFGLTDKQWRFTSEDVNLAKIIANVGPFPPHLVALGDRGHDFFNGRGILHRHPIKIDPAWFPDDHLRERVEGEEPRLLGLPLEGDAVFTDFIKGVLRIDPVERRTAAQLLRHEWLRGVGEKKRNGGGGGKESEKEGEGKVEEAEEGQDDVRRAE
ncbi:kinase-like domain-containing protein [Aspergillus karnatakaensis]|uniref:kinase-like domain-containing protein n=1 Tax=Aspergillus karnatakaensis TaxID=1810916 RepID=UPI003CCCDA97